MEDKALQKAAEKIYDEMSQTGTISNNQAAVLFLYYQSQKKDLVKILINYGKEIGKIIDDIFPIDGGNK